jgi:PKD repeat protein
MRSKRQRMLFCLILFLMLVPVSSAWGLTVSRGPYLQTLTDDSVIVRWRTDTATDAVVRYGLADGELTSTASGSPAGTEHTVVLSGLDSHTQYFYSIGNTGGPLAGNSTFYFKTAPLPGTAVATRFWAIGDSGTGNDNARAVRDAYKAWSASRPADFMIMLGDNAYNDGYDSEYQSAVFDTYPVLLRQLPLWSTLGNHDGHQADSDTQSGPYYDIFDFPRAGEAGGLASGTEAYFSWDYGNIHFISLDSYETDRSANGNMMTWLESDLAMNTRPWVIAIWHHPPYTKGSHDSDTEGQLIDMRQIALPILEAWGVDLVLSGHSHSYERSWLIDGHYGVSTTLDPDTMVLDPGDGNDAGTDGAYEKPQTIAAEHEGAVYAVNGSSGKLSAVKTDWPHPVMTRYWELMGSMIVDVAGNRLDAVFIDKSGALKDQFTILKTPDVSAPLISSVQAEDATHVLVEFTERVDEISAQTPGNYNIPGLTLSNSELLTNSKIVRLTATAMTAGTHYTLTVNHVEDEFGNTIATDSQYGFDYVIQVTKSFQNGLEPTPAFDGTFDAYIREATAQVNYGSETDLQVDGDEPSGSGTDMYIVIGWDVSDIPVSATVSAASIHLNNTNVGGPYGCFALLRAWSENEITWNEAATGSSWETAGALGSSDRDNLELCNNVNAGSQGVISIDLNVGGVSMVQSWVDGSAANHGIIIADSSSSNGADFDSSESADAMNRPRLEVTYSVAPVPNSTPTAAFTYSCTDVDCTFTDTSTDADGSVAQWAWDFGDPNTSADTSTSQNPSYDYPDYGTYTVTLTVTDNDGGTDVYSRDVTLSAACSSVTKTMAVAQWQSFSLPCMPPDATVAGVFTRSPSLITEPGYDSRWVVYMYDNAAAGGVPGYVRLQSESLLQEGRGYFYYSLDPTSIQVDGKFNSGADIPLRTEQNEGAFNLVGNPRNASVSWADVLVIDAGNPVTLQNADGPEPRYCEQTPAASECLMWHVLNKWETSQYATYDGLVPTVGTLDPFDAFWVRAHRGGIELRIPEPPETTIAGASSSSSRGATSSAVGSEKDKRKKGMVTDPWYVRLIAESGKYRDEGNWFGQLESVEDGWDSRDLEELYPYSSPYLSILFTNPLFNDVSWGYTTDYRKLTRKPRGEWPFVVRASNDIREVSLSWQSDTLPVAGLMLIDEDTGKKTRVKAGVRYMFEISGGEHRFRLVLK